MEEKLVLQDFGVPERFVRNEFDGYFIDLRNGTRENPCDVGIELGVNLADAFQVGMARFEQTTHQQHQNALSTWRTMQVGSTRTVPSPQTNQVAHSVVMPTEHFSMPRQSRESTDVRSRPEQPVCVVRATFEPLVGPLVKQPPVSRDTIIDAVAVNHRQSMQCIRIFQSKAQQASIHLDDRLRRDFQQRLQSVVSIDKMSLKARRILERQQQRLLCLRHALWCREAKGTCSVIPNCQEMQKLWLHMGNCPASRSCSYSHCISSKYVLSHFHECTNPKCPLCPLVRFPMEVKETTGQLMMDMDRAIEQLVLASKHENRIVEG